MHYLPWRLFARLWRGEFYFGASEATIFSKHGSPRSGSHHGISFNGP
jgi:hypothetical protein